MSKDGYTLHSDISSLPSTTKFVAMVNESMAYDDGYKSIGTKHYLNVISFDNEEELKAWILSSEASYSKKWFKVFELTPVRIHREINLNIEKA